MAKDAVATMGTVLPDDVGGRDAVHVAVIAVKAGRPLAPGDHVGAIYKDGEYITTDEKWVGIVDPFIRDAVAPGERFWLYLYPRTITGLNHNWTHPDFDNVRDVVYATPANRLESEKWIRDYARRSSCPDLDTLIKLANGDDVTHIEKYEVNGREYSYSVGWSISDEYLHAGGTDAHGEIDPMLWHHLEIVTGKKMKHKPSYFSCSC